MPGKPMSSGVRLTRKQMQSEFGNTKFRPKKLFLAEQLAGFKPGKRHRAPVSRKMELMQRKKTLAEINRYLPLGEKESYKGEREGIICQRKYVRQWLNHMVKLWGYEPNERDLHRFFPGLKEQGSVLMQVNSMIVADSIASWRQKLAGRYDAGVIVAVAEKIKGFSWGYFLGLGKQVDYYELENFVGDLFHPPWSGFLEQFRGRKK